MKTKKHNIIIALLIAFSVLLNAGLFYYLREFDIARARATFERDAEDRISDIEKSVEHSIVEIDALGAFFDSSREVEPYEFRNFAGRMARHDPYMQAIEWTPLVKGSDRAAFERAVRASGFPHFGITERGENEEIITAGGEREEYFPVFLVYPNEGNEAVLGFDLGSEEKRSEVLTKARESGELAATPKVTLVQEQENEFGFIVFRPVYRTGAALDTGEGRRGALKGFALGVFRIGPMIKNALSVNGPDGEADIYVYDQSAPDGDKLVFFRQTEGREAPINLIDQAKLLSEFHYKREISVADRRWLVVCAPAPGYMASQTSYLPFGILFLNFFLIGTLALYFRKTAAYRKHLRKERDTAERYLDVAGVMMVAIGKDGGVSLVNRKGRDILGYGEEDIIGKNWFDNFLPARIRENVKEVFGRLMAGKEKNVEFFENPVLTKSGEERTIAWHNVLMKDESGGIAGTLSSGEDITERKKTEKLMANVLESVDEGFIVISPDYRIISANKAFCDNAKMAPGEVIGGHCYKVSHRLDRPCFEVGEDCPVRHTFDTGKSRSCVHTHYDSKGEPVFIETKSFPIMDESGKLVSVIETLNNITEKRKLEDQLRQAQKMEAIGTMAGGIAHDFNNILTGVIGYAEMLKMDMKEDDPNVFNVNQILSLSDKAVLLIRDILTFGRKQLAYPEPVDLNEALRKTEKFLFRIMGEDISLHVDLEDRPLAVMADRVHMEQVIMNLTTNARDAMPDGGTLTIMTEAVNIDDAFIKRHGFGTPGDYALLSVTDTGMGMDRATLQRIFEPFFTTKEEGKGTGLGLAIIYGIVKQHSGYINAYSEPGKGTTFKIYLPLIHLKVAGEEKLPEMPLKRGSETILVAEDEEYVRRLVKDVLEEFGYKVIEAVDGEDAIAKLVENKDEVQLLYLDVVMPKMSGKEVFMKALDIKPGIRVVFTSGYPSDILSKKDIVEGKVDFVPKPVSPRVLLTKVREALDR